LQKLWQRYQTQGVQVIAINVFERRKGPTVVPQKKAEEFKTRHQLTFPILLDEPGEFYIKFGTGAIPWNVIIDQKGVVRYSAPGFRPPAIMHTIKSLLENGTKR
jgi:peroxiredoxin